MMKETESSTPRMLRDEAEDTINRTINWSKRLRYGIAVLFSTIGIAYGVGKAENWHEVSGSALIAYCGAMIISLAEGYGRDTNCQQAINRYREAIKKRYANLPLSQHVFDGNRLNEPTYSKKDSPHSLETDLSGNLFQNARTFAGGLMGPSALAYSAAGLISDGAEHGSPARTGIHYLVGLTGTMITGLGGRQLEMFREECFERLDEVTPPFGLELQAKPQAQPS